MNSFQFIAKYIKRHRFQYAAGIITLFVVDFANLFIPKLTGSITDGLTAHTFTWDDVKLCLLQIFLLGLTLAIGRFLWRFFIFGAARSIEKELRNDMFGHLEKMSVEYYNEHKTGDLMTRFTSDLNAVRMSIGPAIICVFDATVMTVMVIFQMMNYVNVKLTLLALIPMVIISIGEIYDAPFDPMDPQSPVPSDFPVLDQAAGEKMKAVITAAMENQVPQELVTKHFDASQIQGPSGGGV